MANGRAAIFIDAGYLEKILKTQFAGTSIDYSKFAVEISKPTDILRTYYYNCPPFQSSPATQQEAERTRRADRFFAKLRLLPRFEVRLGRLSKRSCPRCGEVFFQQKRADLMLGVDLVNLSARTQIGTAVLVAGDSDFLPAVEAAKDSGVLIRLVHGGPANRPHQDLFATADERLLIDKPLIDRTRRA